MPNPEIEEFAKMLVQQVRDAAIQDCDRKLRTDAKGSIAQRWRGIGHEADLQSVATAIIPDIVDNTVFQLLRAIDQGQLRLSFTASNGKMVDLPSDGLSELAGWYMGVPGWRSKHSHERLVDDFADLR